MLAEGATGTLADRIAAHEQALLRRRLVLYAGANYPSAAVRGAYAPALSAMPAMGPSFDKEQPGTELVSELEVEAARLVCAAFGAEWAEVRLPSATLANLAVFHALTEPGDLLLGPAAAHGGHLSQRGGGTPDLAGLVVEDLPFDGPRGVLDGAAAAAMVRARHPRMVLLGRSVMLSPDDIAPVTAAARETGAIVVFDASHVAGLIAGGAYPNPLEHGADVMTMSTYKTIAGRPHGLVVGRDREHGRRLASVLDRRFLANYDPGTLPQLVETFAEMQRDGGAYARAVVANTAALALALQRRGFPLRTSGDGPCTHQLLVRIAAGTDPRALISDLAVKGIIVGTAPDIAVAGRLALRVGTQFLTTMGLRSADMEAVGMILEEALTIDADGVRMASAVSDGSLGKSIESLLGVARVT